MEWPFIRVGLVLRSDETRSGYVRYVQGIQPNVPARTCYETFMFRRVTYARRRLRRERLSVRIILRYTMCRHGLYFDLEHT